MDEIQKILKTGRRGTYTVSVTAKVLVSGQNIGEHRNSISFDGEPGGQSSNLGDADHIGSMMPAGEACAKTVMQAALSKAHGHIQKVAADLYEEQNPEQKDPEAGREE
jgi:hypothetical protein